MKRLEGVNCMNEACSREMTYKEEAKVFFKEFGEYKMTHPGVIGEEEPIERLLLRCAERCIKKSLIEINERQSYGRKQDTDKLIKSVAESLEELLAVEVLEYHNKNWLAGNDATRSRNIQTALEGIISLLNSGGYHAK